MSGFDGIQRRIKKINEQAETVQEGKRVHVVYKNPDGTIDCPGIPADGVLVVPRPLTEEEWIKKYGDR